MNNNRHLLRQEYIDELNKLEEKMIKAELFAKKFPAFENQIIRRKLTDENWIEFGERYKKTPYPWGINRGRFNNESRRTINNFDKSIDYDVFLFKLYFNTLTLYDSHEKYGLEKLNTDIVYFYDSPNSTFYIEDEYIEEFLDNANEWYLKAVKSENKKSEELEIQKMEKKLQELKNKQIV